MECDRKKFRHLRLATDLPRISSPVVFPLPSYRSTMRRNSVYRATVTPPPTVAHRYPAPTLTVTASPGRTRRRRPRDEHPQGARVQRDAHVSPYLRAERGVDDESFSRLRLVLQTRYVGEQAVIRCRKAKKHATRRRPVFFERVKKAYSLPQLLLVLE